MFKNYCKEVDYSMIEKLLDCRSMCESIVAYSPDRSNLKELVFDKYLKDYISDLGIPTVKSIMKSVVDSIADIKVGVHTDPEGVSYNSIVMKEGKLDVHDMKKALNKLYLDIVGNNN